MIWDSLANTKKPFFALAPMNDATDTVFRQIVARCSSPDVFFTEFVSVDSLSSASRHAMDEKLVFTDIDTPLVLQVWGNDPKNYEIQCRELSQSGFVGIDINMGCPVAKIISKGACSALIKNRGKAREIIEATKEGIQSGNKNVAISVKTRIGFEVIDLSWIEFLLEQKLDCLIVHCRTTKEQSKVPNHFEVLPEIVKMKNDISPLTKIIANGDISSRAQGEEITNEFELDGIMLGRAIFHDPFVFSKSSPWEYMSANERLNLYLEHIDLFESTWQNKKNPEELKRFAKTYIVGFPGAPQVRDHVMGLRNTKDVRNFLMEICSSF